MRLRAAAVLALAAGAALSVLLAQVAPQAAASGPDTAAQREIRIERSLACPQCTDLPLDVCDQDICADMRNLIHEQVAAGESDAAIRAYFVQRYGSRVLLSPPKTASDIFAWAVPFIGLAAGGAAVLAFLRAARHRSVKGGSAAVASPEPSAYRSRVETEVRDLQ